MNRIVHTLETDVFEQVGCVMLLGTTGKAASLFGGSTMHSVKDGLAVTVGKKAKAYQPLTGRALQKFQTRLRNTKFVIIDEATMKKQKEMHYLDLRLREGKESATSRLVESEFEALVILHTRTVATSYGTNAMGSDPRDRRGHY
jgi:hypothetical protein